jgi:hypothetical protein
VLSHTLFFSFLDPFFARHALLVGLLNNFCDRKGPKNHEIVHLAVFGRFGRFGVFVFFSSFFLLRSNKKNK